MMRIALLVLVFLAGCGDNVPTPVDAPAASPELGVLHDGIYDVSWHMVGCPGGCVPPVFSMQTRLEIAGGRITLGTLDLGAFDQPYPQCGFLQNASAGMEPFQICADTRADVVWASVRQDAPTSVAQYWWLLATPAVSP